MAARSPACARPAPPRPPDDVDGKAGVLHPDAVGSPPRRRRRACRGPRGGDAPEHQPHGAVLVLHQTSMVSTLPEGSVRGRVAGDARRCRRRGPARGPSQGLHPNHGSSVRGRRPHEPRGQEEQRPHGRGQDAPEQQCGRGVTQVVPGPPAEGGVGLERAGPERLGRVREHLPPQGIDVVAGRRGLGVAEEEPQRNGPASTPPAAPGQRPRTPRGSGARCPPRSTDHCRRAPSRSTTRGLRRRAGERPEKSTSSVRLRRRRCGHQEAATDVEEAFCDSSPAGARERDRAPQAGESAQSVGADGRPPRPARLPHDLEAHAILVRSGAGVGDLAVRGGRDPEVTEVGPQQPRSRAPAYR